MLIWCHIASSSPLPPPRFGVEDDDKPRLVAAALDPAGPRSKACRTPSKYSFRFLSNVDTRRSLFVGKYPSSNCHVIALTSSGIPDQAKSRSSGRETVLDCRMRLNLLMRVIRAECASICLEEASDWGGEWLIRFREFAGSSYCY